LRLFVYSSGSVEAQRQLFGHSVAGDLTPLFAGFFDMRIGAKREPRSPVTVSYLVERARGDRPRGRWLEGAARPLRETPRRC